MDEITNDYDPKSPMTLEEDLADEIALAEEIEQAVDAYFRKDKRKCPAEKPSSPSEKKLKSENKVDVNRIHADPAFLQELKVSYALDYNYTIPDEDLFIDVGNEYTSQALFGIEYNDPFMTDESFITEFQHFPVDHSKPNVITRQIEAFNASQQKLRVPRLSYTINKYKPGAAIHNKFKNNRDQWDNLLKELALTTPDVLELIMKPDFYDVIPMLISRFKAGLMPQVTTTWVISQRFVPEIIYNNIRAKNLSPDLLPVEDNRLNGTLIIGTNVFHYYNRFAIKQNLYRRLLIREDKRLSLGLELVLRQLKFYHESMRMVRNLPRFYKMRDRVRYETLEAMVPQLLANHENVEKMFKYVFVTVAKYKVFRYTFEDRNKEYLYFAPNARSSYYRYEIYPFDNGLKSVVLFSPDKRFTHHSFMAFFEQNIKIRAKIYFVSDLSYVEHSPDEDGLTHRDVVYMENVVTLVSLKQFYISKPQADRIYIDFVEVKRKGATMMGTYCEANRLAVMVQQTKTYREIVLRAGFSDSSPLTRFYVIEKASMFKAGGLEFICYFKQKNDFCEFDHLSNLDIVYRIAAAKLVIENDRRHYIIRGFDYRCTDPFFPVNDIIDMYFPDAVFNLTGQRIKTMAYQHTRATNKFTTKKEDLLDNYISLHKKDDEDYYGKISTLLIQNGFDVDATVSQLADSIEIPADRRLVENAMKNILNIAELRPDLKRAIATTTVVPKSYDYLKKKCPDIDNYMRLFEYCGNDHNDQKLYRFYGVSEMTTKNFIGVSEYRLIR